MILSYIGQPFAGQVSNLYVFGGPFTLSANFVGSYAPETQWRVNATADATFQVYKLSSGVSTSIGTVKIPGGGGAATYVGSGATFLGGDACYAVAPSPQDATLTDVAFLIDDGTSLAPPPIVTLVSVAVAPSAPSVAKGLTQAFVATGTYSDSSTQTLTHGVTWMSSNTAVATIASTGVASTLSVGASNITASYGVITSPTATLTVSAAVLASLSVTPINSTIAELATTQFAAAGIYTDGTSVDLTSTSTWASSNTAAATISSGGLATGVGAGFTTITATHSPFSGNTVLIGQGDTTFTFDGYGLLEGTHSYFSPN